MKPCIKCGVQLTPENKCKSNVNMCNACKYAYNRDYYHAKLKHQKLKEKETIIKVIVSRDITKRLFINDKFLQVNGVQIY